MLEVAEPKGCLIRVHPCTCWFYNVLYRLQQFVQVHITSRYIEMHGYIMIHSISLSTLTVLCHVNMSYVPLPLPRSSSLHFRLRAAGNFCDRGRRGHGDIAWLAQEAPLARDFSGQCQTATQTVGSGGLFEAQPGSSLAKWDFCPSWLFKGLANWMQQIARDQYRQAFAIWRSLDEYDETYV